jgi:hypothetical protein
VGEVAVEADRRAERAEDVEAGEHEQVGPVERDSPEQTNRREDPERGNDDGDERHDLADSARARPNCRYRCAYRLLAHKAPSET